MQKNDTYEKEILDAYERDELKSVAAEEELAKLKAAGRFTKPQLSSAEKVSETKDQN